MNIGEEFKSKRCGIMKVVRYGGWNDVDVEFLSTGTIVNTYTQSIRSGEVRDRNFKTVYGVGWIGYGRFNKVNSPVAKKKWVHMLERCYSPKLHERFPTYKNCEVCNEWKCFQTFAEWFYNNYPKDGGSYDLDKDIIKDGNKLYSPSTCKFVTRSENSIKAKAKSYKMVSPSGDLTDIYNMSKFCRDNNLTQSLMLKVLNGARSNHKGWTRPVK